MKIWVLVQKCFWSLVVGFLWICFLFKDTLENDDYESCGVGCFSCAAGTVLPIGVPALCLEFWDLGFYELWLIGLGTYLFIGLILSISTRDSRGHNFFPVIIESEDNPNKAIVFL